MKIRKWDSVKVMSGKKKDRWVISTVVMVNTSTCKIIVKDVNVVTRHVKKQGTTPGQIVKMEKAIDISNVMLICPFTEKSTRVWYVKVEKNGKVKVTPISAQQRQIEKLQNWQKTNKNRRPIGRNLWKFQWW